MTRKEIISGLDFTVGMFLFDPTTGETFPEPRNDMDKITIDACRGAIELLEQEPILDMIRAEIEQEQDDFMDDKDYDEGVRFGLMLAYQIIDKYTADSEGF